MIQLDTIQKRGNITKVWRQNVKGSSYIYVITTKDADHEDDDINNSMNLKDRLCVIQFQNGPRKEPSSTPGIIDSDLLEIVRDRLKDFQKSEYATRDNTMALMHIEEALMWMNKRVEDRMSRGVLGTTKV